MRVVLLMLIESGPAWRLFRVALCDHLRGWDMGGVGGYDDGDDGQFVAQCGHRVTP